MTGVTPPSGSLEGGAPPLGGPASGDLAGDPDLVAVVPPGIADRMRGVGDSIDALASRHDELSRLAGLAPDQELTWAAVFNGYAAVLVVAFLVTLIATPLMRSLAVQNGVIDRPSDPRKIHRIPIAYLGGVAVFLGIVAGIFTSYTGVAWDAIVKFHDTPYLT